MIRDYTDNGFRSINNYLRYGTEYNFKENLINAGNSCRIRKIEERGGNYYMEMEMLTDD